MTCIGARMKVKVVVMTRVLILNKDIWFLRGGGGVGGGGEWMSNTVQVVTSNGRRMKERSYDVYVAMVARPRR